MLLLYALQRCLRDHRYYRGLSERFGFLPRHFQRTLRDSVWLHAVSVGEVLSAEALVRELRAALPGAPVFVSCSTVAGREAAEKKLAALVDGVFYLPVDYVFAVRSVLRRIRPAVLVILETEIWPNLYREVKRAGCALVCVNGRISDKALPRYAKWAALFRHILQLPDLILTQSEEQSRRYVLAGAPAELLRVGGNLKYDFDPSRIRTAPQVRAWIEGGRPAPLWIAASTVAPEFAGDVDEDDAVLEALRSLPGVRLVLAPRKPERFEVVAAKLKDAGIRFARRTSLPADWNAPVLLLDSIGELGGAFRHADVVFVGGTLAHRGGHNVLEPAAAGRAIIVGPHLENFAEIQQVFRNGNGFVEIGTPADLAPAVQRLLGNGAAELGRRALALAESERGATARAVAAVVEARWSAVPKAVIFGPLKPLLFALSRLWTLGGVWKRRWVHTRRLPRPVISVGGLAMGGAGKTPAVRALVQAFRAEGWQPGVLTRGYGRQRGHRTTVLAAGSGAPVSLTGDEAQTVLRDGAAHLGIDADRYAAGMAVLEKLGTDLFVLDDGFQHSRVARDLDVVVLDGLDPFAGGGVFPLGHLREPLTALRRADLVAISRTEGRRFDGVVREIRRVHPGVPILLCSTRPGVWVVGGERRQPADLAGVRVGAFCGIGNPAAFWRTLEELGCDIAFREAFRDHHPFAAADLQRLRENSHEAGAAYLITTEKDAMRLNGFETEISYLTIEFSIEDVLLS